MIRMRRNAKHDDNYTFNNTHVKEGEIMLLKGVTPFKHTYATLNLITPKGHSLECLNDHLGMPANINTFDYIGEKT